MLEKKAIATDKAPKAVGPYSQAVEVGDFIFVSGQIPLNPETGALREGGIEEQTHQVFANMKAIVEAAGCTMDDVVKTTIYVADIADFAKVNGVYGEYFAEPFPARAAIQAAALPLGAGLEMEAIVRKRN